MPNTAPFLKAGQTLSFTVGPLKADGTPSTATLSALAFTSSDPTVFTVAADPATPNGGIITVVTTATGTLTAILGASAVGTEPDGVTTEALTGTAVITVTDVAPPPAPASSLGFNFGNPVG